MLKMKTILISVFSIILSLSNVELNTTQTCGPNEQYYQCVSCDRTCKNPVVFCPHCTQPGCNCISGYIKDTTQTPPKCVPEDSPSCIAQRDPETPVCNNNELYYQCRTCPKSCAKPHLVCDEVCIQPGNCDCKPGFLRDTTKKPYQCIRANYTSCVVQSAPKTPVCAVNEIFYGCGSCPVTCAKPNNICANACRTPGNCDCKPGFLRDTSKTPSVCIPAKDISCVAQSQPNLPVCGDNEQYYECRTCPKSCFKPNVICDEVCIQPGNCDCKPGFLRDTERSPPMCVPDNDYSCMTQKCSAPFEKYYECSTDNWPRYCSNPPQVSTDICKIPGNCDCIEGYLRDNSTLICIDQNSETCINQKRHIN